MSHARLFFLLFSLLFLAALQGTNAVTFKATNKVENSSGGVRFTKEIGLDYSKQTLSAATSFIWRLFQQNTDADRKNIEQVTLFVEPLTGAAAVAGNGEIHLNSNYVQSYSGDVKIEVTGVLYHETTHIWQWFGNGNAPGGLIEGMADYVRLKAGLAPSHWVKPGQGDRWDQGYDVIARFLDYCNSLSNGFVAVLNEKMRTGYSNDYFVQLLGKTMSSGVTTRPSSITKGAR